MMRWVMVGVACTLLVGAAQAAPFGPAMVDAMQTEMERNLKGLHLDGYPRPYFIAYQLKSSTTFSLAGREGALVQDDEDRNRWIRVEVRVGDYHLDNSEDTEGQGYEELIGYQPSAQAPLDDEPAALRHALWLLTDRKYKEALAAYHRVKGKRVYAVDEEEGKAKASFTREKPVQFSGDSAPIEVNRAAWEREVRRASALLGSKDALFDSGVSLDVRQEDSLLVNSEGSVVQTHATIYGLHLTAHTRSDDGMLLEHSVDAYGRGEDALPRGAELDAAIERLVDELMALRGAPVLEPYTGPAILLPRAAGVIFHEAVGHRLEADRQGDSEDGRTFAGQIGKSVLPEQITVLDDPTVTTFAGVQLNGHYTHDDEGVPAQRTTLVEDGVLRGFLLRRKPAESFVASNGHGRAQGNATPVARMGNLIVEAKGAVSESELKKMLIAEARKQGKPFGLIIGDIAGGSTNTSSYGYQAFKGAARMVYKVDAKTGEETLVRGVEVVGTPLASINKIVAASTATGVFNGYCGAESGYVPVSTVAPAILFREIELQRSAKSSQKPQILLPPVVEQQSGL